MSQQEGEDVGMAVDQRDLPPALHAKALAASAVMVAVLAVLAMRYFL